ncbi:MAG: sigma-70 family RNA polymerase sigma factor [Nisaea sp.]|uniref:sigma factor-like helix-turn-helix DNA-binding protein n=1 Tax=Nisaea sp. TaxID=2024842 RepID=UPI001B1CD7D9|nr:sigma factor-like helix-turn-helix DNA-binding protein [Nisaea sp.]MBO6559447.1 sigma-70 family RNA polymerase sigma factor [Nisaea sp.]
MNSDATTKNNQLLKAIENSEFGSVSRLAEHLGVHYNCLYTYLRLDRSPIDQSGYVKYDAVAMCEALGFELPDLFPPEALDRPYRLRETYDDGYGQRAYKGRLKKYFPERELTGDQVDALIALLDFKAIIPPEAAPAIAEELIRRMPQDEYEVFSRFVFEGMPMKEIDTILGIGTKAIRARYSSALKQLNSPVTLKVIREFKAA